ncbi:MAG TPA: hypothetical protein VHF45_04680 [Thermoleophilaceae bacterium]|nr:hypothetical protein [Thermoleophilaceae bacterium]
MKLEDEQAEVQFGRFRSVLMTKDHTPLEPESTRTVRPGASTGTGASLSGGGGGEELITFHSPR